MQGSQWRKWDLHVHTPASYLNNQFGTDWDRYVQTLFRKAKEKEIYAIGLADYFTIDGYKKVKNDYLSKPDKMKKLFNDDELSFINNMLILPNVEFRLNKFVGSSSINLHVIFSNNIPIRDIEENFLHELDFVYEGTPLAPDEKHKLKLDNLAKLGRKLKAQHARFSGEDDICVGMRNAVVDDSQISVVLEHKPSKFKGKYLLGVVADEDLSEIDWDSRDHQTRKVLIQKSSFLLASNPNTVRWAIAEEPYREGVGKFVQEFKSLKPCIHGCDAHDYDTIGHPCIQRGNVAHSCLDNQQDCELRYCWIKADLTFEGLRQILYEPKLRTRIQEENPDETETYAKISDVTLNLPNRITIKDESGESTNFCLNGKYHFTFSNNLTCIIGGRGSGKSTLAHVIYNSWMNQDIAKLSDVNSPLVSLHMPPNPLKKVAECTTCDVPSQTEFFFQNEIEYVAKTIESMSTLIRHRLEKLSSLDGGQNLDALQGTWSNSLALVSELVQAYDQISEIDYQIARWEDEINTLRKQTEIIKSDEYKNFQAKIAEFAAKIADYESYRKDYERLIKEIDSLVDTIEQLQWTKQQGKAVLFKLQQSMQKFKIELEEAFNNFKADYNQNDFPGNLLRVQQDLRNYLEARGLSPENIQELTQANRKIKELEEEIRAARLQKQPFEAKYNKKNLTLKAYKSDYIAYKKRFTQVISSLEERLKGLSISNKEINFLLHVDRTALKHNLVEFVKASLREDTILRSDVIEQLLFDDADINAYIDGKEKIREHLNKSTRAEKHRHVVQELINDDVFLERLHLRMFRHSFDISNIKVQTKLGGKLLKNTSFGERCGIVMAIVLVAGTNPIFIDQPEDHLEGKFISDVLLPLIRTQKHNRQIILITRDANVVIGGDAELIHILESTDERTHILPSTIEDISCREKYIWILDGGTEAFARREQKYDIALLRVQRQDAQLSTG